MKIKSNSDEVRYVLYARKSTSGLKRQSKSIEDQIDAMRELAKNNGFKIVKVFEERVSAKRPNKRPVFNRMLQYIEDGYANGILCWRPNRLARNSEEGGKIIGLLERNKVKEIRTHSSVYRAQDNILPLTVEFGMASQYSRDMIDDIKRGMLTNCEQGIFNHRAPQGYINGRDSFSNNKPVILKDISKIDGVEENRFELIKKAFATYLTGDYSVPEIWNMLKEWGYTNRDTGRMISNGTLHHILRDVFYMGYIRDYKDRDKLIKGDWEPMISEDEYWHIQHLMGRYAKEHGRKPRVSVHAKRFELRGVMRCATCQCSVIPELQRKRLANGGYSEHIYYRCTHKSKIRPCSVWGGITQEEAYAQIDALLDRYTIAPDLYKWGMNILANLRDEEIRQRHSIGGMQNSSIEKLNEELRNYTRLRANGEIDEDEYRHLRLEVKSLIADIEQSKRDIQENAQNWYEIIGKTLETLVDPKEKFDAATCPGEKRRILQSIGPDPVLNNGRILGKDRSGKVLTEKIIEVEPYPWLIPLHETAQKIGEVLPKVLTVSNQIENASNDTLYKTWCWK